MFFGEFADKHKDTVSLKNVRAKDFKIFLVAIAPLPPPLDELTQHVITLLRLAGQFQVDTLIDKCTRALLENRLVKQAHSFVERLKAADELLMEQFRDKLIEGATQAEIHEAAQKENKEKFSGQTWTFCA
ncbi:hypothetical protein AAVH_40674 [Aphelenchoides avenae]|nr:hypothetical protein AAVH_40674 [Aphelenchus avenae]